MVKTTKFKGRTFGPFGIVSVMLLLSCLISGVAFAGIAQIPNPAGEIVRKEIRRQIRKESAKEADALVKPSGETTTTQKIAAKRKQGSASIVSDLNTSVTR